MEDVFCEVEKKKLIVDWIEVRWKRQFFFFPLIGVKNGGVVIRNGMEAPLRRVLQESRVLSIAWLLGALEGRDAALLQTGSCGISFA